MYFPLYSSSFTAISSPGEIVLEMIHGEGVNGKLANNNNNIRQDNLSLVL